MSIANRLFGSYYLVVVILISLVLHIIAAFTFPVSNDEGAYLYDGYAITKGLVPMKDFYTKSPLLIYTLAVIITFFGRSILAARLISIVSALLTGVLLYKIGKVLFNREVGLIASILYLLTPFSIAYTTYLNLESFHMFFVTIVIYSLLQGFDTSEGKYYVATGVFMALSMLVRRTALILILIIPLCALLFSSGSSLKSKLDKLVLIGVGLIPIIAIFSFYFISQAGFDRFFHSTVADPTKDIYLSKPLINKFLLSWNQIKSKFRFFYSALEHNLILFLPLFLFFAVFLKNKVKLNNNNVSNIIFILYSVPLLFALLNYKYGSYKAKIGDETILLITLLFALFLWKVLRVEIILPESRTYSYYILLMWIMMPTSFYLLWYKFRGHYLQEFIPVLSLISAVGFKSFNLNSLTKGMKLFLIFLLTFMVIPNVYQIYVRPPSGSWDLHVVYEVSDYIKKNTKPGDEIFTAATIFPFLSERDVVLDISHPTIYYYEFIDEDVRNTLVPEIKTIQEYLIKNSVEYVVIEHLTKSTYFSRYPKFEEFILSNYMPVERVYNPRLRSYVIVYKHKR